ncbi:MAG: hypothetical protein ACFFAH_02665 [Promethearchaeota archaeon]
MIELSQVEIFSGFSSIVGIMFSMVLGFLMISKYFKYRDRNLLLMGLVMILISQPWWPYAITLMLFFVGGEPLPLQMYIIIGLNANVIVVLLGTYVMTNLIWKDKVKLVMVLTAIYGVIYQTVLFYAMFVEPERFATLEGALDVRYLSLLVLFLFVNIMLALIFAIFFFRESHKSPEPEIRLKGVFYLISLFSYVIGSILDAILPLNLLFLVIVRILLTFSAFMTYLAFAMPNWAKKLFLRKD